MTEERIEKQSNAEPLAVILPERGKVACYMSNGTVTVVSQAIFSKVVMMENLNMILIDKKRWVSYREGALLYSMSERHFRKWSQAVNAVSAAGGRSLVDRNILDRALEYSKKQ